MPNRPSASRDTTGRHRRSRQRYRPSLRSALIAAAALAGLAGAAYYGDYYWTTGRFLVSTDDAYLQADNVIISPKVSGYIAEVLVKDNQPVKRRPGAGPHRRSRLSHRARRARRRTWPRRGGHRQPDQQIAEQQLVVTEAQATVECRPGGADLRQPGLSIDTSALSRTGAGTVPERAEGDRPTSGRSRRRWSATPRPSARRRSRSTCCGTQLARRGRRSRSSRRRCIRPS